MKAAVVPEYAGQDGLVDLVQHLLVEVGLRGPDPEADDPQGRGIHDLQVRTRPDVALGPGRKLHPPGDGASEGGHPESLDRHPDLQGADRAAQLQAAVREVRVIGAPYRVLKDIVLDRESALQGTQFLHHEDARLIGLEEPLVGVEPDRIGALDPAQQPLAFLRHHGETPVRGVHVQPDSFGLAEVGHRFEGVDLPGAGRPGVGAYRDGVESGPAVVGDGAREGRHVQAEASVGGNHADALRADADDPRRADVGAVALVAHVHGRALGVAGLFPGGDEGVEAGRRAPAREESARGLRVADPAPDPVEDDQLQLTRTAGGQPGALVDVVPGGHEVGQHSRPGGR